MAECVRFGMRAAECTLRSERAVAESFAALDDPHPGEALLSVDIW